MFAIATLLFCCISLGDSGNLVQLPNGNYAITGKGCGVGTIIKYSYHIPTNVADHDCVLIQDHNGFNPFDSTKTFIKKWF